MKSLTATKFTAGLIITVAGIALSAFGLSALFAKAATGAVVTATVQNGSNVAITTAPINTPIHAFANVSSSTSASIPTGTVDFLTFPNTTCSGQPSVTQQGVTLVNGTAHSATTSVPATGTSFVVHYNGDASTTPNNSACAAVTATAANNTLTTTLSTTTSVFTGSIVHDSAALNGATSNAGGSVAYSVYTDNACTLNKVSAGIKAVTNGIVPDSDSVQFSTAGTFYWQAVYSGDAQNAAATSSCTSEVLTVVVPPVVNPPVTINGTISGTVYKDVNGNATHDAGDTGLQNYTINLHSGSNSGGAVIASKVSDANGFYSFTNLAAGTYFVEEIEQSGLTQDTSDTALTLSTSTPTATVDFGNATSSVVTGGHKHHGDNDGDDDDNATSTDKGHGIGHFLNNCKQFLHNISNGRDKGLHLGEIKHGKEIKQGKGRGKDNH